MSSGECFAYSTSISKKPSRKTPVSSISSSRSFRLRAAFPATSSSIWKPRARITIEHPHVAVRRRAIAVEINLLYVLAVISLRPAQAEEALLQERVAFVPEGEGKAKALLEIRDAREAVLVPAIDARPRVIMRKVGPRFAIRAVILAHGSPRALGQVWPPRLPSFLTARIGRDTRLFGVHARDINPSQRTMSRNHHSFFTHRSGALTPTRSCSVVCSRCRSRRG